MTEKHANPFIDLLLTLILPSVVLESLSKPDRLGPAWALVVALLLPLGFGIWCYTQKRGLNFFSVLGLVAVLVTGGLGLLQLEAMWFAAKEAAFPIFLGIAFPVSYRLGKPLIREILMNPQLMNEPVIHQSLDTPAKHSDFARLLRQASWGMAGTMLISAAANFALALWLLGDKAPGSEEYTKAIGRLNWGGFIVIGIPLMGVTLALFFWFLKSICRITGLERHDFMNGGQTVRRQVKNEET